MNSFGITLTARHSIIPPMITGLVLIAEKHGMGYHFNQRKRSWFWGTTTIRVEIQAADDKPIGPAVVEIQALLAEVCK